MLIGSLVVTESESLDFFFTCFLFHCFQVASLFEDHSDLLDEFTRFLPDSSAAPLTQQVPYGRNSTQHYNERSSVTPTLRHIQMDNVIFFIYLFYCYLLYFDVFVI